MIPASLPQHLYMRPSVATLCQHRSVIPAQSPPLLSLTIGIHLPISCPREVRLLLPTQSRAALVNLRSVCDITELPHGLFKFSKWNTALLEPRSLLNCVMRVELRSCLVFPANSTHSSDSSHSSDSTHTAKVTHFAADSFQRMTGPPSTMAGTPASTTSRYSRLDP